MLGIPYTAPAWGVLPRDIWNLILNRMDKRAVSSFVKVSRWFYTIAEEHGRNRFREMNFTVISERNQMLAFLILGPKLYQIDALNFSIAKIVDLIGFENFAKLPVVDVPKADPLNFGTISLKQAPYPIMRGLDPFERPFITLNNGTNIIVFQMVFQDRFSPLRITNGKFIDIKGETITCDQIFNLLKVHFDKRIPDQEAMLQSTRHFGRKWTNLKLTS